MSVKELAQIIGKETSIYIGGLTVYVRVTDVKMSYGRVRYQVSPLLGAGSIWVESISEVR